MDPLSKTWVLLKSEFYTNTPPSTSTITHDAVKYGTVIVNSTTPRYGAIQLRFIFN